MSDNIAVEKPTEGVRSILGSRWTRRMPARCKSPAGWDREHDARLVADLENANFSEQATDGGVIIHYAHLHGSVHTCDGVLYWSVAGGPSGEKILGANENNSVLNYGRAAVKSNLIKIADGTLKSAHARLAQA